MITMNHLFASVSSKVPKLRRPSIAIDQIVGDTNSPMHVDSPGLQENSSELGQDYDDEPVTIDESDV